MKMRILLLADVAALSMLGASPAGPFSHSLPLPKWLMRLRVRVQEGLHDFLKLGLFRRIGFCHDAILR
jgi:hypothetical protein